MDMIAKLRNKNIEVTELPDQGLFLRRKWESTFACHLSEKEKKFLHLLDSDCYNGLLWHLFSYKKKECLEREEAEKAFYHEPKYACYVFFQDSDDALLIEKAMKLHVRDLVHKKMALGMYIVDKEFTWTFVTTHEKDWCGPYFSRMEK
ncbi:DUF4275 family protein [Priestia taiwanensis]|uniref:ATP synthase F1 subunit delta n=1 Tax=Priestia taiwanensis TaxID=1347902 RepID=A0A917ALH4_9BACI|nr:DUF4275 family protein [Priestia taiwanensis]MBM7362099.1 hypothetical protein [Priestia taiwanensis]GGE59435.1 ATP synthase F1 subunit delta [Priestia taiwanensis]